MTLLGGIRLAFLMSIATAVIIWGYSMHFVSEIPVRQYSRYSYYLCAQIYNESEHYLTDWLDHHFNVIGIKNICVINVGPPLSRALRQRFSIAYVEKKSRQQEFHYCLSSCFMDEPMRPSDLLMVQDIDEYLNVRTSDCIAKHYDKYDMFHLKEIRYGKRKPIRAKCCSSHYARSIHRIGYVLNFNAQMINRSLRATNRWRKPHHGLDEYEQENLKALFKCKAYAGWPACAEGNGKEMIRVGAIKSLSTHFHRSIRQPERRFFLDMKEIRLNHYMMRTKEDAVISASKWSKLPSRLGQMALNPWFRIVFDDSILDSKRLI